MLAVVFLLLGLPTQAFAGYASIVVDASTGRVLQARNADMRNYPASLTKMMTLYLLFEAIDNGKYTLESRLPVSKWAANQAPSKLGVAAGTGIKVEHAIKALVTKSANDVAVVIAEALGGTEANFSALMTRKAAALGMSQTTFRNASGLPNNGQMTTARDMAVLSMALIRHFPNHYRFFATQSFRFGNRTITTHNHVVREYPGADGLKTGYIQASGFNVASSAVRNGRRLVAVVFGGQTARARDTQMMALLDEGFATLAREGGSVVQAKRKPDAIASIIKAKEPPAADMGSADDAPMPPAYKPGSLTASVSGGRTQQMALATPMRSSPAPSAKSAPGPRPTPIARTTPVPSKGAAKGDWGIQVGAYAKSAAATAAANKAIGLLAAEARRQVSPVVVQRKSGSGTIYRARLTGLSNEAAARTACATLVRNDHSCLVVAPQK
ncbi:serine-type D-Ala-D-Ala carboxypeptidase [Rhodospirillum rubrum F11]|nr:D-alanyl-D-alanine carboxypeptidase family protein [Rhodospirillum rubrum]AEO48637.1 serine-type D-Ala-D-Ala carboxypeptidase [Rhodospirillum rubrum F11]QXG78899.1 D-alanyl-D-alanine carboxypeptidase [Rhodospirillum rubrum]